MRDVALHAIASNNNKGTARKFGVQSNQVRRWRKQYGSSTDVLTKYSQLKNVQPNMTEWLEISSAGLVLMRMHTHGR